jgi:hypothetical protein
VVQVIIGYAVSGLFWKISGANLYRIYNTACPDKSQIPHKYTSEKRRSKVTGLDSLYECGHIYFFSEDITEYSPPPHDATFLRVQGSPPPLPHTHTQAVQYTQGI